MSTAPQLAQVLDVRFRSTATEDDLNLADIRKAYRRHGFPGRAADLITRELEAARSDDDRYRLLVEQASSLVLFGQVQPAREAAHRAEDLALLQIKNNTSTLKWKAKLAELYASEAYGEDYERALQMIRDIRALVPEYDMRGHRRFNCLYHLKRFDEAWRVVRDSIVSDRINLQDNTLLYRMGIAAHHARDFEPSGTLLRIALYRNPKHALADTAREILNER